MDKYVGKRLDGRYEIKDVIGVGGMAYVYKAYDSIDDRTVAVKILRDEYLANEEFTRRFKNESKAIAILSHPNIVKVYDVSFGERLQYIVMEYIDGITLKEYIEQQQDIKWKEAVHFTVQILRALQHAHDKGIVHRDIKPQNIMLLPDGTIKVTDFGIARFSRNEIRATSATDKAIGSVHYISPEQARGDITDEKADIYSTGVMLYEMLTGRLPFEADSAVSVAIMQLQSEPKLPREINPSIPEGLEEITIKAMQKDPAKRYQSAAEMLYDIDEFKRNPSIHFEYKYFVDETPTRFVEAITKVKGETALEETPEEADELAEEGAEEEKKGPPVLPILAAIAGAFVVVGLIFVAIIFIFGLVDPGKENIEVENFVGKTLEEVTNNEEYAKLYKFNPPEQEYSNEYDKGVICKQNPKPGTSKKIKVEITLTVSMGKRTVQIPEVQENEHKDVVVSRITAAGFVPQLTQMTSDTVAKDRVVKTVPAFPDQAEEGSVVVIYVSTGEEEPEPISVPNVINLGLEDAKTQLRNAGFIVNDPAVKYVNDKSPKGTVLQQSLEKGSMQKPGTECVLTVSSGFQDVEITVPLPDTTTPVDVQVYVNGKLNSSLSDSYKNILPSVVGNLKLKCTEQAASYNVTIMLSVAGKNDYKQYASYTADALAGSSKLEGTPIWTEPSKGTTTTTTTVTTTTTTTTTTEPEFG
ncbi:MAG: Stk1 family PASTA domain-containing Ser/Thr kinase [Oscillospiraceae bacterium]|nr:Stk1 family PASTA domain-containing Ser/Thr kinase [Oscillospiraceae bacterium]